MTDFYLNAEALDAINQETRACFLLEDAPNYLAALTYSLEMLQAGDFEPDLINMMQQALHSLKGGAGIAQLSHLSRFAHKLEDLLESLRDRHFPPTLTPILGQCIDEIAGVLAEVKALPVNSLVDLPIGAAVEASLDRILKELSQAEKYSPQANSPQVNPLVKSALTKDLEQCLIRAEQVLQTPHTSASDQIKTLQGLAEECTLLGEALDLPWLLQAIAPLEQLSLNLSQNLSQNRNFQTLGLAVISSLRSQRQNYLDQLTIKPKPENSTPSSASPILQQVSHLRIPTSRMDSIASTVGELLVRYERMTLNHQQLAQTNQNLRQLVKELNPVQEQVQTLYDQLAIDVPNLSPEEAEFDPLELDQYTAAHLNLQNFQELLLRIREARADIDITQKDLGEEMIQLRGELDHLYGDVTKSRLVPFKRLAERFLPQLKRLGQQYDKSVNMIIEGEEVLIDQVILEQLQTPLNHLVVNAFDHGIERDRLDLDKPETAQIILKATVIDNQVEITLSDDGCGIDLGKIYQKAIALNLCDLPLSEIPRSELLDLMFLPGFSTADQVSMLSGRGMGLEIVRSQISNLRGTIRVDTIPGQGTTFTIRLPLGLSLLPLLISAFGNCAVAFPSTSVLDIFLTTEAQIESETGEKSSIPSIRSMPSIQWRHQSIPLFPLSQLLPFAEETTEKVILVLHGRNSPFAVKVDAVLEEKPLILKPFDNAIAIPSYLAGCTILGTGKVVSVILPQELNLQFSDRSISEPKATTPTILIAEDSVATRNLLERTLKQLGYKVIGCRDGQQAWETLKSLTQKSHKAVQLVISDIEMPRLNGFGLLQSIRTDAQLYAIPVIMLTSRSSDRHRQKALSLGASDYLTKPFNANAIAQQLQQLLG
jgi:chemotaxis protein histidine kinase CheA/ActR/RegA family two-component response regulator